MELRDTIALMLSSDYKDRFKAEYMQLKIRIEKLEKTIRDYDKLSFTPTCSKDTLVAQLSAMKSYLSVLEFRGKLENVF